MSHRRIEIERSEYMQTKEELNLADTIKGEINRMCVTNDIAELDTMALHARGNIKRLQSLRYASITADTPQTEIEGEWQITECYPHNVYCSRCHKRFAQTHWAVWEDGSLPRNYCPNCGKRMRDNNVETD